MLVVTGGAGFIGSALVWALNQKGITQILVVDHLDSPQKEKNLENLKFSDYLEREVFLKRLLAGDLPELSGVIHLGAITDTREIDLQKLLTYNYEYSKQLALWCLDKNKQLVYASSAATYGDGKLGFGDEEAGLPRLKPLNPYGYSKQLFDLWIYENGFLDRIAGLKYFNVYGPNEYHKGAMSSVVYQAFGQVKVQGKVKLFKSYHPDYPDGGQLRDFIYVKDAVEMTLLIYEKGVKGIFNLGSGKARSFYDLALAVFQAMEQEPIIEYIEMPPQLKNQYQYYTQAQMGKMKALGIKARYSLEAGVKDYVRNYLLKEVPYFKSGGE